MFPICFFFLFEFVQSHPIGANTRAPRRGRFFRVGAEDEPLETVNSHEFARGGGGARRRLGAVPFPPTKLSRRSRRKSRQHESAPKGALFSCWRRRRTARNREFPRVRARRRRSAAQARSSPLSADEAFEAQPKKISSQNVRLLAGFLRGTEDEPLAIVNSHEFARGGIKTSYFMPCSFPECLRTPFSRKQRAGALHIRNYIIRIARV